MCFSSCKNEKQTTSYKLDVMTYNIRLDVASDGENAWASRKDFLSSQVLFYSPDILGIQEARPNQMTDLKDALKDYKAIGIGRDGDNLGEYSAIFYNSKKISVELENTFWLSETPNKVSKGWDAAYPRICTYGLFTDKKTKKKFWVFNTHLDNVGEQARNNGINLVVQKINEVNTKKFPVILTGDFNETPENSLIINLKKKMLDTREVSITDPFGSYGTFNGFLFCEPVINQIDYIFISKSPKISVLKYGVLTDSKNLKYPSDHFPVLVELQFD
jgi:endonuclease/exonuclease/phosphatase family metal-dependent hydrolase